MYNPTTKINDNIEAIRIALNYREGDIVSAEDIEKCSRFAGWGGVKCVLLDPYTDSEWETASKTDQKLRSKVKELHNILKEAMSAAEYKYAVDSIKNATLSSFYTPDILISTFYKVLKNYMYVDKYYDPCSGSGLFLTAGKSVINMNSATLYEKDLLTCKVLKVITSNSPIPVEVYNKPFEQSSNEENGKYSLICSNIPFGAIPVFDKNIRDRNLTSKVHNYFFAKGLEKISEGSILAYVVTNAFLDTVSNKSIREYVFSNSDFISLTVLPDNMFKETANTEAPSHFLVVRKNSSKTEMSEEEKMLCISEYVPNDNGVVVSVNKYIQEYYNEITIGTRKIGKNQYGKPTIEIWWDGDIAGISKPFSEILSRDFEKRWKQTEEDILYIFSKMPVKPTVYDEDPNWVEPAGLASAYTGQGDSPIPVYDENGDPNYGSNAHKQAMDNSMPPWEELPNHIQLPVEKEQRFDIEKAATHLNDLQSLASSMFSKATDSALESTGMMDLFKTREEWEQEDPLQKLANIIADKHGLPRPNLSEDDPADAVWIEHNQEPVVEDSNPGKKLKPKEKEIMQAYLKIKEAYTALENEESKNE